MRPPQVLGTVTGVYQGGAIYYAGLSLPHLGDFALKAKLGSEPIGAPLHLVGTCPVGLSPMLDGITAAARPAARAEEGQAARSRARHARPAPPPLSQAARVIRAPRATSRQREPRSAPLATAASSTAS